MDQLDTVFDSIQDTFEGLNDAREAALARTRKLIRECANTIRAIHRREWDEAKNGLSKAREIAASLRENEAAYPELYHSGYTQDALREYVEAELTYVLVHNESLPTPDELKVEPATYVNGLAEAASELRRHILDIIRHHHTQEAERLLDAMDAIYSQLITVDFTDAITHGLRRRTDVLRNVLERTRGDVTTSFRQQQLQNAIEALEKEIERDDV
ncbi:MAG: haloacid dehalogenase [Chloroflexi bacterium]|nr:haloacid dehalogenase [Chloroflexota bacterium]